mgnify:CR=1 FL=1
MGPMKIMFIMMIVILLVYFIDGDDHIIGNVLNYGLSFLDFGGQYPVLTLLIVGTVMALFTTLLRAFTTDQFEQAKSQHVMSEFNTERRKAMMSNNTYAMKKLEELQPHVMAKNMEVSQKSMKTMPYTMIVIIPLFLWVRYFVYVTLAEVGMQTIMFPWGAVSLTSTFIFPVWVFVYMLISIPLGQVINKVIRWYIFNKKLKAMFRKFFHRKDTFSLGVCNGCQMLSQLKDIIPGAEGWPKFIRNISEQFEARYATIEIEDSPSIFFKGMTGSKIPVAVAHGEGRAEWDDGKTNPDAVKSLRYVDGRGNATERYPYNPNGSIGGQTAFTSADGRATIMMPHPERGFRACQLSYNPGVFKVNGPWMRMFENAYAFATK